MSNKVTIPFTPEKQVEYLQHLKESGNLSLAAAKTGISYSTVLRQRKRNKKFDEMINIARSEALGELVSVAKDRAIKGVEEPVFYKDQQIGTRTVYDNNLLWKLIESNERGSYNKKEATGNTSVTVNTQINASDDSTLSKLSTFLKIDLTTAAEKMEAEIGEEDSDYAYGEAREDDIIDGECYPTGSE